MSHTPSARHVILCDAAGRPSGSADILAAHTGAGQLHLAFSVYVFSPDRRRLLVQQRSAEKMLWPLVWANTCCSHPRAGEPPPTAGVRPRPLEVTRGEVEGKRNSAQTKAAGSSPAARHR